MEVSCANPAEPVLLTEPTGGVPPVVSDQLELQRAVKALASGHGPVALDTERASGYRYSQRAYLIQIRRQDAGTVLVDPIALGGRVDPLREALTNSEWVLHAASQDLPCLAELELRPAKLFDTELAGRLCGFDRVALGPLIERMLGFRLEKGHGAADWSRRPLPAAWLNYAALDVELLVPLRDALEHELSTQNKLEWALQEFEAVRTAEPATPRAEPWRRVSGINKARNPRQLAAVRALWEARDALAKQRDIAPGRVLPDSAIVEAAVTAPATETELIALPVFRGKAQRKLSRFWAGALRKARTLPQNGLPVQTPRAIGPPQPNRWAERDPEAAARLSAARTVLGDIAKQHRLPVENLLLPDLVRRLCWSPPADLSQEGVADALQTGRARPWQIELTAAALSAALTTGYRRVT